MLDYDQPGAIFRACPGLSPAASPVQDMKPRTNERGKATNRFEMALAQAICCLERQNPFTRSRMPSRAASAAFCRAKGRGEVRPDKLTNTCELRGLARNSDLDTAGCGKTTRPGKSPKSVKPCLQKYSDFQKMQITLYPSSSRPTRGAFRDRHGRGAGCGGR